MRFLAGRLWVYALAAWASITLNFFLPRMMPGDPISMMFASFRGQLPPEALEKLRATFGLSNDPMWMQYFAYCKNVLTGQLGISISYFPEPASAVIGRGLLWTFFLFGVSISISMVLGSLLGILAAWRSGGRFDSWVPPVLSFIGAFPYFWVAMAALFIFGFKLGWFPLGHAYSDDKTPSWTLDFALDVAHHAILPGGTLVVASVGGWMLSMRNSMIGVLGADSITFAEAKGLSPIRVVFSYAARNALLPNITQFGMALGFILGGALLTEMVFAYPGQGYLLLQAVRNQDYPLMQGIFLTITLAVLGANWLVDLAYYWLDPRTRRPTA